MIAYYSTAATASMVPSHAPVASVSFNRRAHALLRSAGNEGAPGLLLYLKWSEDLANRFKKARFFRILRPMGWKVGHEYFGVAVRYVDAFGAKKYDLWVAGLVNETDWHFFQACFSKENHLATSSRYYYEVNHPTLFSQIIFDMNNEMRRSPYRSYARYLWAMVTTPVLGQPCSNLAEHLEFTLKKRLPPEP